MMPLRALSAQETAVLYGSMRDSSGQPLRATVRVVNGAAASVADAQGRYQLSVPAGLVIVRVGFLGYRSLDDTLTLAAGDSLERDYRLGPAVQLQPVIVTAAKRSQLLSQVVTSVALVTDTDVARRAVTTVDEAVDKTPGVQFLNGQVNIRGSSGYVQGLGSRVLLLVDGVPANQGDRAGINRDLVPPEDVARVERGKGAVGPEPGDPRDGLRLVGERSVRDPAHLVRPRDLRRPRPSLPALHDRRVRSRRLHALGQGPPRRNGRAPCLGELRLAGPGLLGPHALHGFPEYAR